MAIEAELPDGTIMEFPDETEPSIITRAAKRYLVPTTPEGVPIDGAPKGFNLAKSETLKDKGILESVRDAGGAAIAKRGVGIFQGLQDVGVPVNKAFGVSPEEFKQGTEQAVKNENNKAKGTGVTGFLAESTLDPINFIGVSNLGVKQLAKFGAASGATSGLEDSGTENRVAKIAEDTGVSVVGGKVLEKVGEKVSSTFKDFVTNKKIKEANDISSKLDVIKSEGNFYADDVIGNQKEALGKFALELRDPALQLDEVLPDRIQELVDAGVPKVIIRRELDSALKSTIKGDKVREEIVDTAMDSVLSSNNLFKATKQPATAANASSVGTTIATPSTTANTGLKLLTADEVRKGINSTFISTNVDSLTPFKRMSGMVSKKNGKIYGTTDSNRGDIELAKLAATREQGSNVRDSILGDTEGRARHILDYTDGKISRSTKALPYTTIVNDAKKNSTLDQLAEIRKSGQAMGDYAKIRKDIADKNTELNLLTRQKASATGTNVRFQLTQKIRRAKNEIRELNKKKPFMDEATATATFNKAYATPEGKQFIDRVKTWHDYILDKQVESGLLSPKEAADMRSANPFYWPEFRSIETFGIDDNNLINPRGIGKQRSKEISAHGELEDAFMNDMTQATNALRRVSANTERQYTLNWALKHMDDDAFKVVFRENKADVEKAIADAINGNGPKVISPETITLSTGLKLEKTGNFEVAYNGKVLQLTVKDNNFLNSLINPNAHKVNDTLPGPIKWGLDKTKALARLSRNTMTTWVPAFQARAWVKTVKDYGLATDSKITGLNRFNPKDSFTATKELIDNKALREEFGANISPGALNKDIKLNTSEDYVEQIRKSFDDKTLPQKLIKASGVPAKKIAGSLEEFAEISELGNRYRYYKDSYAYFIKEGKSPKDAELLALNNAKNFTVNYLQRGYGTWANNLASMTPFLRTAINGTAKSISALRYRPKQVAATLGIAVGWQYSVNMYNKQFVDEDGVPFIHKVDPKIRARNTLIWYGDDVNSYVAIPNGFELLSDVGSTGAMLLENAIAEVSSTIVDTAVEQNDINIKNKPALMSVMQKNNLSNTDMMNLVMDGMTGKYNPLSLLPVGLREIVTVKQNRDAFNRPISPEYLADLPANQRGMEGKTLNISNDFADAAAERGIPLDPNVIEYVTGSIFGSIGDQLMKGVDLIYSKSTGKEIPALSAKDAPLVSSFTGAFSETKNTGVSTQYFNVLKSLEALNKSNNNYKTSSDDNPEDLEKHLDIEEKHKTELQLYHNVFAPAQAEIKQLYKEINRLKAGNVRYSNDTTPEQEMLGDPKLKDRIASLRNQIQEIQQSVMNEVELRKEEIQDSWEDRLTIAPSTKATKELLGVGSSILKAVFGASDADAATEITIYPRDRRPKETKTASNNNENIFDSYEKFVKSKSKTTSKKGLFDSYDKLASGGGNKSAGKVVKMNQNKIIEDTIKLEGGFNNIPEDRGGATNYGISLKFLKTLNPNATVADIKNMSKEDAKKIYIDNFWVKGNVDKLPKGIQDVVFDSNVNHGLTGSAKLLQRALNSLGAKITIDGRLGDSTIAATKKYNTETLRKAIIKERKNLYNRMILNDPSQEKFKKGWNNRLNSMLKPPMNGA